jgi:predicted ArsR family transcriptional regulator
VGQRGDWQRELHAITRQRIKDYMQRNPLARQGECAKDLSLGQMTVSRHMTALRAEWLAERQKAEANG